MKLKAYLFQTSALHTNETVLIFKNDRDDAVVEYRNMVGSDMEEVEITELMIGENDMVLAQTRGFSIENLEGEQ